MDTAVCAGLDVTGMGGEVRVLAMFNDQPAFGFQKRGRVCEVRDRGREWEVRARDCRRYRPGEDEVGQSRKLLQGIRRIGKDEVILHLA